MPSNVCIVMTTHTAIKKKSTPKATHNKTKRLPTAKCDNTDIGVTEFQVYYSCDNDGQWEHDKSFNTQAEAEAYCRKKSEVYAKDAQSGVDAPIPWEFYIYEVRAVRSFQYAFKIDLVISES